MRRLFIIVLFCVAVLLAGYAGYRGYRVSKNSHLIRSGHKFLAKSDGRNAALAMQEVLRSDPNNLDATAMMAQLADASRSPSALLWRNRLVELDPHSLKDRLALAQTALTMRDYAAATNALEGVDTRDRETAAYHNIAGAVAVAGNKFAEAATHFLEACRIDPQNTAPQLNLAVVRLHGTNTLELMEARTMLQFFASNSTNSVLRCQALRELTLDATGHNQEDTALALSQQLMQETNSVFTDRLLRLEVLKETQNADFEPALNTYQREAAADQSKIYELATWEMSKTSPGGALAWLRGLPMNTQTNQPTTLLVAECYSASNDWPGLGSWLEKQRWGALEFIRHALFSRALRGQELPDFSKGEWEQALKAAGSQKISRLVLLRLSAQWGWRKEAEQLLWIVVNQYPNEKWAAQTLTQRLFADGGTRSLMALFSQEVKATPSDLESKNNLAMTALLLNAREMKPHELAREVYNQAPTNSSYVSTYAFSLLMEKQASEALRVIEQLKPAELANPLVSGYYGMILEANGHRTKGRRYLELAAKAPHLPEERKLFELPKTGT